MPKKTKQEIAQEISESAKSIQDALMEKFQGTLIDESELKNPYGEVKSPHPDWWNNNNG